ncbi:hypothetical protein [Azospirillum picis]|uniref:Cell division protein FtsK n=1 Tax=Azospirillum picis TaxID=488438 RepID=A0ABU0MTN7_9PROT|nr:hypothetical protein [Azospirillum picis]MBP2302759.1 hypothetical protein [Azospirillum picis]MDQ0536579.1 hypothetical protein [Azospirillum picis]
MLVYGDLECHEDPQERIRRIRSGLATIPPAMGFGTRPTAAGHGGLVALFIEAAELAQGLADHGFEAAGEDAPTPLQDAAMALVMALALRVAASWSAFPVNGAAAMAALERLSRLSLPPRIRMRRAEGHAFYALYPEAYLAAAKRLPPRFHQAPTIIGLRSIGTGLAAMAAVALNAPPPVTLRPTGHPFRRELRLSSGLRASLLADPDAHYVVVDEGPGLSGSSFGAVADWLEAQGVASGRIAFLPGHGGDLGDRASDAHRRRWARAARPVVAFEELFRSADGPFPPLEQWFADRLGPPVSPLKSLSGGAWRAFHDASPPTNPQQERLKFLLHTAQGRWLLKFAGLGRSGKAVLERARALHEAGFTPEPVDLRHGFLAERWLEDARPLADAPPDALPHLAAYLCFRARHFPAVGEAGAGLRDLLAMARTNIAEAMGDDAASALDRWEPDLIDDLAAARTPVVTDNRLHLWEWLRLPDGRLVKTDALDHAAAHDLIGCQDIAWDVAGAIVEFGLTPAQADALCISVRREVPLDLRLLEVCLPCYIAFQIGYWTFAAALDEGAAAQRLRYEQQWRHRMAEAVSPVPAVQSAYAAQRGEPPASCGADVC